MQKKVAIMAHPDSVTLHLQQLCEGIPALTAALGQAHAESAAVCLENQGHSAKVKLFFRDSQKRAFDLMMSPVTEKMRRAYFDLQRATELGACGIAILLAREVTGLTAIQQ